MLEQQIQSKIIKRLEQEGFFVLKLIKTNKSGIMDLLAVKESRTIFVEVKQEHGKLSEIQRYRINELRNKKIECYVWTSFATNYDKKDPFIFKL
jgi:Holliday junction resolvase-like predicted endonuclease